MELVLNNSDESRCLIVKRDVGRKKPCLENCLFPARRCANTELSVLCVGVCFYNEEGVELERTLKSLRAQEESLAALNVKMDVVIVGDGWKVRLVLLCALCLFVCSSTSPR